jgi:glycosyltransferase involved in cell wall biosynthesis
VRSGRFLPPAHMSPPSPPAAVSTPALRVLYLLPQPYLEPRGSSFRAHATVRALRQLGMSVDLLCYPHGEAAPEEGVRVFRSPGVPGVRKVPVGPSAAKALLDIPFFFAAFWRLLRGRYDVVHGVEEAGLIAWLLARLFRRPYVFDMHSWMTVQIREAGLSRPAWLFRLFERMETSAIRGSAAVITVGDFTTAEIRARFGGKIAVTLHDFAPSAAPADPVAVDRLRAQWVPAGRKVLLYTGNFVSYQGLDLLVDAMARVVAAESTPPVLLIVGGGGESHPDVVTLRARIHRLGLDAHVRLPGSFSLADTAAFTAFADALVSPRTLGKNTPLKVYSYLASGRLVVATRIASHTQVLHDGNSLLADPDPESLAGALREALRDDAEAVARRERLVAGARADVARLYNADVFRGQLAAAYAAPALRGV